MTEFKNNKFLLGLKQPPRSMKNHGKHRRASPPAYGSPVIGTDHGTGGSATVVAWSTQHSISQWDPFSPPERKPVPYAGIRTGEIIAHRAWWVINDHDLRSLAHYFIWEPGATITGDITKPVEEMWNVLTVCPVMEGVYAHRTQELTIDDIGEERMKRFPMQMERPSADPWQRALQTVIGTAEQTVTIDLFIGIAVGTVKLWGEVVEHERGYRASSAKIVSIDQVWGCVDLGKLRAKYTPQISS